MYFSGEIKALAKIPFPSWTRASGRLRGEQFSEAGHGSAVRRGRLCRLQRKDGFVAKAIKDNPVTLEI